MQLVNLPKNMMILFAKRNISFHSTFKHLIYQWSFIPMVQIKTAVHFELALMR